MGIGPPVLTGATDHLEREILRSAAVPRGVHALLTFESESSDEQLLALFQRGSQRAFEELYYRHCRKAHALAMNLTRDENDACEVVQEAYVRVLLSWSHFEGQATFFTWLYRIVFNLSIDRLRRSRRKRVPLEHVEEAIGDASLLGMSGLYSVDPFEACSTTEANSRIAHAIQSLPRHHRDVIVMREVHGMSYTEMAQALGCSKGTIMSRLFHARQRLQGMLSWLREEGV